MSKLYNPGLMALKLSMIENEAAYARAGVSGP